MATVAQIVFRHRRPALAKRYADGLLGGGLYDLGSGLFLTAPRGAGKSTFLQEDLIPELRARDVLPIYLDLWADRSQDPAQQIRSTIGASLMAALAIERSVSGTASARCEENELPTDAELADYVAHASLTDLFEVLVDLSGKRACLLIDEIQQASTLELGAHSLYALKAARDALTLGPKGRRLALVFAGSHREQVIRLVRHRAEAFYGAMHEDLPLLDKAYTDDCTASMNAGREDAARLDPEQVWALFQALGRRPDVLASVLASIGSGEDVSQILQDMLVDGGAFLSAARWRELDQRFDALSHRQQAALRAIVCRGGTVSPFSAEGMTLFSQFAGSALNRSALGSALTALVRKGLLWRPVRGKYAPGEDELRAWYVYRRARDDGSVAGSPGTPSPARGRPNAGSDREAYE